MKTRLVIIRLMLVLTSLFFFNSARAVALAEAPAQNVVYWTGFAANEWAPMATAFTSFDSACNAWNAHYGYTRMSKSAIRSDGVSGDCFGQLPNNAGQRNIYLTQISGPSACPAAGASTTDRGFYDDGTGTNFPPQMCANYCEYNADSTNPPIPLSEGSANGALYKSTGKQCSSNNTIIPPPTCPAGQHLQTSSLSGVHACFPDKPKPACDVGYHLEGSSYTNQQCVADPPDPPPCPLGIYGTVNGVLKCITSNSSSNPDKAAAAVAAAAAAAAASAADGGSPAAQAAAAAAAAASALQGANAAIAAMMGADAANNVTASEQVAAIKAATKASATASSTGSSSAASNAAFSAASNAVKSGASPTAAASAGNAASAAYSNAIASGESASQAAAAAAAAGAAAAGAATNASGSGSGSGTGGDGSCDPTKGSCDSGSATAGNCITKTPPTCTGDSLQCALLSQQFLTTCSITDVLTPTESDKKSILDMKNKADQSGTADESDSRVSGAHSQSDSKLASLANSLDSLTGNNAQCFGDITITVLGRGFVIPLSKACPIFQIIRLFFLLMVGLLCMRMLLKTVQEF